MDLKGLFGFENKNVVITGAGSGMGKAAARLLAEETRESSTARGMITRSARGDRIPCREQQSATAFSLVSLDRKSVV